MGARRRTLGPSGQPSLRIGLRSETRRPGRVRPRSMGCLGRALSLEGCRSYDTHRKWQREGQLLDDGRDRPLRSMLRAPCRPHTQRRLTGQTRQQRLRPLHRDLEPRLHPIQRRGRWHISRTASQACRYRHGLRTRVLDHPKHQGFHRFFEKALELRHRCLHPDLPQARRTQRQDLCEHLPRARRRPLGIQRRNENRDRLPRDRRPPPHTQFLDRRWHHARQQRQKLCPS